MSTETKKSIGNAEIGKQPKKSLRFVLNEKSVDTKHLKDKSVTFNKLGNDVPEAMKPIIKEVVRRAIEEGIITDEIREMLNSKQDVIEDLEEIRNNAESGSTAYQKPVEGIPSEDMSSEVQLRLNEAMTAMQPENTYSKTAVDTRLSTKQDALTFDQTPTLNSSNPVTSGGVRAAIDTEKDLRIQQDNTLMQLINHLQTSLLNYYLKTETYSKSEINNLINAVGKFQAVLVSVLPTPSLDTTGKIYLLPAAYSETSNVREEWITVLDESVYKWEHIGSTNIDLSGYSTTTEMNAAMNAALQEYTYTKAVIDSKTAVEPVSSAQAMWN